MFFMHSLGKFQHVDLDINTTSMQILLHCMQIYISTQQECRYNDILQIQLILHFAPHILQCEIDVKCYFNGQETIKASISVKLSHLKAIYMIFCAQVDIHLTCLSLRQFQIPILSCETLNVVLFLIMSLQSSSQKFTVQN